MSGKRDSNSRPRPWQGRALPTELLPHFGGVGVMNRDANLSLIRKFPNCNKSKAGECFLPIFGRHRSLVKVHVLLKGQGT